MSYPMLTTPPEKFAPPKSTKAPYVLGFLLLIMVINIGYFFRSPEQTVLANITLDELQLFESSVEKKNELIAEKNHSLVRVMVDQQDFQMVQLKDLGIEFSLNQDRSPALQSAKAESSSGETLFMELNYRTWNDYLNGVRTVYEEPVQKADLVWEAGSGWKLIEARAGRLLTDDMRGSLQHLVRGIEAGKSPAPLSLQTVTKSDHVNSTETLEVYERYRALQALVAKPIAVQIQGEDYLLDLQSQEDFVSFVGKDVVVNEELVGEWVEDLAEKVFKPAEKVTIVGKREVRPGVFKAVVEGEFKEGLRIKAEEVLAQIMTAIEQGEQTVQAKSYEIPVKVISELEGVDYQLLSVGYSEYSTGNAPNRVHNVQTGLDRINGILIERDQEISFNKSVGSINNDFRMGYGIFGSAALPVLGGGICQVSTTFYRSLLNLGVPITMRQNHSWDLSYYQSGGYGLDATIFPEKGLDVKAVNDLSSQLLIYAYTRPETQEAFVLIYGKGDGRKVSLQPEKDYVPFKGGKTLKWTQTVEMPDGEIRENQIVSRYRS